MNETARVLVTGGSGFIGRRLVEALRVSGRYEVLAPTRVEVDLEAPGVENEIVRLRPDGLFHLAAYFGGVHFVRANSGSVARRSAIVNRAVMFAANRLPGLRVVVAGSACMYPSSLVVPGVEPEALVGAMHESVSLFGETKRELARWALRHGHTVPIFSTVYGPGDCIQDPLRCHFLGGLLGRIEAARLAGAGAVDVWGTGRSVRDIVYVDDAVSALVHLFEEPHCGAFNVASDDMPRSIADYAQAVCAAVGYEGDLRFDPALPDGQHYKALDTRKIRATGWRPATPLDAGLRATVAWMRGKAS